jgi:four helix bundle protein
MDAVEMQQRTFDFSVRVVRLVRALPKTVEGRAVGAQLVRAGTSVGANYRASCKARSKAEFVAKIGVVEEEVDESAYWMELIIATNMLKPALVEVLLNEARELRRMTGKSRVTAASRLNASRRISNGQSAMGNGQSKRVGAR